MSNSFSSIKSSTIFLKKKKTHWMRHYCSRVHRTVALRYNPTVTSVLPPSWMPELRLDSEPKPEHEPERELEPEPKPEPQTGTKTRI